MNLIDTIRLNGTLKSNNDFYLIDSNFIVCGGDKKVLLYSVEHKKIVWTNDQMRTIICSVTANHNGSLIGAAGGLNDPLMILTSQTGTMLSTMDLNGGTISCFSFRKDDKMVVGLTTGNIVLANWKMSKIEKAVQVGTKAVWSIAISPKSDDLILSADGFGFIKLISLETETVIRNYENHSRAVWSLQWNHDGSKFVSASFDHSARLYSLDQINPMVKYEGHNDSVRFATLIHDDEMMITVSRDSYIKCWKRTSGRCLKTVYANNAILKAASKNGQDVALLCVDGSIMVYSCPGRNAISMDGSMKIVFPL
jgi:WD40 repeat protein